jgi:hypothetical protein
MTTWNLFRPAAIHQNGRVMVFGVSENSSVLLRQSLSEATGEWEAVGSLGGIHTSPPAVIANADGRIEVFARGSDNALYHKWQVSVGSSFSDWESLGGWHTSPPAVGRNADGKIEVFAVGTGHALYRRTQQATGWGGWQNLGGSLSDDAPAVIKNSAGQLEIFAIGTDGRLYRAVQSAAGSFGSFVALGGSHTGPVIASRNIDGRLEVFTRSGGQIFHTWQSSPGGSFGAGAGMGGSSSFPPAVGCNADGRLEIFIHGSDHMLYHKWQLTAGSAWSDWFCLGGQMAGAPVVQSDGVGRLRVFFVGSERRLYEIRQQANQTWSPPTVPAAKPAQRRIALRTSDGTHVVCAERGGNEPLNATRTWVREWETFTLQPQGRGRTALVAYNGKYVRPSDDRSTLIADQTALGPATAFYLKPLGCNQVALTLGDRSYVGITDGNGLSYQHTEVNGQTTFHLLELYTPVDGSNITLKGDNGLYLARVVNGSYQEIRPAKNSVDQSCVFTVVCLAGGKIALQADNDLYLSSTARGDYQSIEASKSAIDASCYFSVVQQGPVIALQAANGSYVGRASRGGFDRMEPSKSSLDQLCLLAVNA